MKKGFILNSFFTQGYSHWAELFLESSIKTFGDQAEIWVDTFNIDEETKIFFETRYPDVKFNHLYIAMEQIANDLNLTKEKVSQLYHNVETGIVNSENFLLKVYISVQLRYRGVIEQVRQASYEKYSKFVHCDIDLYFRKDWARLDNLYNDFDLAFLRRSEKNHLTNILGAFLIFNLNGEIDMFLSAWEDEIQKVLPRDRWRGFGQSALWFAYKKVCKNTKVLNLKDLGDPPFLSKTYEDSEIWLNSNNRITGVVKHYQSDVGRFISWVDMAISQQHYKPIMIEHQIEKKLLRFPTNKLVTEFKKV